MGHMKKSWGKTIKIILGVLVGNLVLSFAVAALSCQMGSSWEVQPVSVLRSVTISR